MVYTIENSVTLGGHFLLQDALHLTEWSRKMSHLTQNVGTNNQHPVILRNLCRMMIWIACRREARPKGESCLSNTKVALTSMQIYSS